MRTLAAAAAVTAMFSFAPAAEALPPIPDWPLGVTCHYTQVAAPGTDGSVFSVEGGPLLPVTDKGEQVTDVEVSCFVEIVPGNQAYPTVTMSGTSTSIGGVAYLPRQAKLIQTGPSFTRTICSKLTWTDSTGTPRTGGSCSTV